jgi:hypothetical protein
MTLDTLLAEREIYRALVRFRSRDGLPRLGRARCDRRTPDASADLGMGTVQGRAGDRRVHALVPGRLRARPSTCSAT